MVSTHAAQYIQDCPPSTTEMGKSPLALLAKTCETIGLPDAPTKKTPEKEKKLDSPRRKDSPRAVRDDSKPFPFLPFPYMPMMHMMPPMPFFPPFKPGCASALVGRPCIPGQCCPPTAMDMYNPLSNPLYAAYAGMMPSVSGAPSMPSYQSLLAATAAQSQAAAASAAAAAPVTTTAPAAKLCCSWTDADGVCGKSFCSADELASHVRSHAPTPKAVSTTASPAPTATPARSTPAPAASPAVSTASAGRPPRFHPYSKPMVAMPPMGLPLPGLPFPPHMFHPLQAMFQQRLLPSMPMP